MNLMNRNQAEHIAYMSEKDGDSVQHESGMFEVDTSEKLEADVRTWMQGLIGINRYDESWIEEPIRFLDRKAAITERETAKQFEEQAAQLVNDKNYAEAELAKRDKGIERLKNRRDALAERVDYWQKAWREACAETERYRELCGKYRQMANEMLSMEVD